MNGFRKHLWQSLKSRVFRREYVSENVKTGVAMQIKAMRESRGWSQIDLAQRSGKAQSAIARLEDPDYGKFTIQTLLEMADAFDVWLSVEFIAFSKGVTKTEDRSATALNAVAFDDDWEGRGASSPTSTLASELIPYWPTQSRLLPRNCFGQNTAIMPGASAGTEFYGSPTCLDYLGQPDKITLSFGGEPAAIHQLAGTI
jgi:transcriptional regulator with XRE-family HTH domain